MKNRNLVTLIAIVATVCIAAVAGTAWWLTHKNSQNERGSLARLPATSFVVVTGNLEALRRFAPAQNLRDWITRAQGTNSEAGQRWTELTAGCGFDPWERASSFTVAADRSVLQGQNRNDFVAYLDGRFTEPEATRCLTAAARLGHKTLTSSQVNGHTVQTLEGSHGRATIAHAMPNSVLVADRTYQTTALNLAYGNTPGLDANGDLAQMLHALGRDSALSAVIDVAAVRAQNEHSMNEAVDDMVESNPTLPDLALVSQGRTGGLGVRIVGGDLTVTVRLAFAQAAKASSFTRALQGLYTLRREALINGIQQAQSGLTSLRLLSQLTNPEMNSRFETVDAAFQTARTLAGQVQITQAESSTVATLHISAAQVHTFEEAARALREIIETGSRRDGGLIQRRRRDPFELPQMPDGGLRAPVTQATQDAGR